MGNFSEIGGRLGGLSLAILATLLAAACGGMPKIAGLQAPVSPAITGAPVESPQYRNLANLPERPTPPDSKDNDQTVRSLTEERAKAAEEGERLRTQPFATPDPGMRLKVEE
jgi:hypothetical protein